VAVWRRKADALLPELRGDYEPPTPYGLFFALLPLVRDAHRRDDTDLVPRAYAYAQWCWHQQRGNDLKNAVSVAFYEHLFDDWSVREEVVAWLHPTIATEAMPLWESRLPPDKLAEVRRLLAEAPDSWRALKVIAADA
jgi:hypothetical protein